LSPPHQLIEKNLPISKRPGLAQAAARNDPTPFRLFFRHFTIPRQKYYQDVCHDFIGKPFFDIARNILKKCDFFDIR
jgi:hypothetical protein